MRSIFFLSHFHLEVIKLFSVTPSTQQSPCSMPIARIYKHNAIPYLSLNTKCQDILVRYTQGYNGQGFDVREIMININMEGSKDYSQHIQLYFYVFQSFLLNINHQSLKCSRAPRLAQNISSTMCFRVHPQHKQTYIYI